MENNKEKIKYYKQNYDKISGDEFYDNESEILSSCGLKGYEIDNNFHIINGEHIKDVSFYNDEDNKKRFKFIKNNKEEIISDSIELNTGDITTTTTIKTVGGPLSELFKLNGIDFPDINPNTDIQSLLISLFCQEKWCTPSIVEPYIDTTYKLPNINIEDAVYEVGTLFDTPEVVITHKENVVVECHEGEYKGFDYGFSRENNNKKEGVTPENIKFIGNTIPDLKKSFQILLKLNDVIKTSNSNLNLHKGENLILPKTTFEIGYGDNTLKFELDGPDYTQKTQKTVDYYACSNLGNTSPEYMINARNEETIKNRTNTKSIKEYKITGDFKYFIGWFDEVYDDKNITNTKQYTSKSIRETDKKIEGWVTSSETISHQITIPSQTKGLYIAIPKKIKENLFIEAYQKEFNPYINIFDDFKKNTREVEIICGGETKEIYEVYTWSFPGGIYDDETFLLKINKK